MVASGSVSLLHTGGSNSFTTFIPTPESYRSPPLSPDSRRRTCPAIHLSRVPKTTELSSLRGMVSSEEEHQKDDNAVKRDVLKVQFSPVKTEEIRHHSISPSSATASGIAAMSLSFIINDDNHDNSYSKPTKQDKVYLSSQQEPFFFDQQNVEKNNSHLPMDQINQKIVRFGSTADLNIQRTPATSTNKVAGPTQLNVNALLNAVCAKPDCYRTIRGPLGSFCKYHKQSRFCKAEGCGKSAKTGGFCISHGGGKRCSYPDCTKSAKQGGLCISHGGGKRCGEEQCTKSALVGGFCSAHGGGRKCQTPNCTKTALLGGFCIAHGGGKRCQVEGCAKSAVGGTLCVSHGGGKRCQTTGCNKGAVRNGVCIRHGAKRDGKNASPQSIKGMKIEFSP